MSRIEYPGLENLPALTQDRTTLLLLREGGHVTLVVQRMDGQRAAVLTLHRAEATKLAERLKELADGQDGDTSVVEGAFIGGPPRPDQLLPSKI